MWKRKGILALVLCAMLCVSAFALEDVQMDALGSISLRLHVNDVAVPGGEVTLYRVGEMYLSEGTYEFRYVDDFAGCHYDLTGNLFSEQLADHIWRYAVGHQIKGVSKTADRQGKITFEKLPVGLYLLCQTEQQAMDGYLPMNPFLISIPCRSSGEDLSYHVIATPKLEVDTDTTPPPPTPPCPPPKPPCPPPKPPKPGIEIPDTGQNNWPVPVLAIAGLLIFALGWSMRFNGRNSKDET